MLIFKSYLWFLLYLTDLNKMGWIKPTFRRNHWFKLNITLDFSKFVFSTNNISTFLKSTNIPNLKENRTVWFGNVYILLRVYKTNMHVIGLMMAQAHDKRKRQSVDKIVILCLLLQRWKSLRLTLESALNRNKCEAPALCV